MAKMLKERKIIDCNYAGNYDVSSDELSNQDTLDAMKEVEDILGDKIGFKKYHSFKELREELNI